MATESEIIGIVQVLASVYGKEPGDMRGFYWALADVSAVALNEAAQEIVKTSKWMPAPSELRELAIDISKRNAANVDYLMAEFIQLEHDFANYREYDFERLERIAVAYDRADRIYTAGWIREKSRRWQYILDQEKLPLDQRSVYDVSALGRYMVPDGPPSAQPGRTPHGRPVHAGG